MNPSLILIIILIVLIYTLYYTYLNDYGLFLFIVVLILIGYYIYIFTLKKINIFEDKIGLIEERVLKVKNDLVNGVENIGSKLSNYKLS